MTKPFSDEDAAADAARRAMAGDASHRVAAALMCAALVAFAALDGTAKYLAATAVAPLAQIIWLRFLGHVVFSAALAGARRLGVSARSARPAHQMLRGLLMAGATGFNFAALQALQLDETAAIFYLTPLVVAALSWPLLGEKVSLRALAAIAAGFAGAVLIVGLRAGAELWAYAFALAATLCYALYNISTRYLARFDPAHVTQFYTPLAGAMLAAPFALADWRWPADAVEWLLLASLGLSGGLGHWLLILAHARAPAAYLAPLIYLNLLAMTALGFALFGDRPDWSTLAGAAVIVASGLYLFRGEKR